MTVRILTGDCRTLLQDLPDQSVHCCVTSPPYWGLRSYLPAGHPSKGLEIGLEPCLDDWVRTIVEVFGQVYRILKKDGTLWLNLGDSYNGSRDPKARQSSVITGTRASQSADAKQWMIESRRRDKHMIPRNDIAAPGFRNKDMHGQPWRAALALQGFAVIKCRTIAEWADMLQAARAAGDWAMVEVVEQRLRAWDFTEALRSSGWILRQEIIWSKANPMPESMKDRCTKSHEHIFLFAKTRYYYFDYKAIQEPANGNAHARTRKERVKADHKSAPDEKRNGLRAPGVNPKAAAAHVPTGWDTGPGSHRTMAGRYAGNGVGFGHGYDRGNGAAADGKGDRMGRGPGWRAKQNESFSAAIVDPVDARHKRSVWTFPTQPFKEAHYATFPEALVEPCLLAGCPPGGTVLDPFGGSGTVGLVADRLRRSAILMDLDERNEAMATERIVSPAPLLAEVLK